ncbi:hypothetical protein E2C01_032501 [Portunus trituberculatus]|uniref:Uncharacterized protein n=1 Tax=Portunus trituberculatus TaxID=210409 RepID=A0A5B7EXP0_PORTR|nr:hypothetical protein [Portunus trituberculatus]
MKDTAAFLLLLFLIPLLLLLLTPGGFLGVAHAQQCSPVFQTTDHEYRFITAAHESSDLQINTTVYVHPQQDLKILLNLEGSHEYIKLVLDEHCFSGDDWQWWTLWMQVKLLGIGGIPGRDWTDYKFQVRTNMCIKQCTKRIFYMYVFDGFYVWASGASQWRFYYLEKRCGQIPQWRKGDSGYSTPECTTTNHLPITISPATPTITSTKPTTPPPKPITTSATLTPRLHRYHPCTPPFSMPVGAIEGVAAATVLVVVVMLVLLG